MVDKKHEGWKGRSCDNCLTRKRVLRAVRKPSNMDWAFYVMNKHCAICNVGVVQISKDCWEQERGK